MEREAALDLLDSPNYHVRLRAARVLANSANAEDLPVLTAALSREDVTWVEQALTTAIERAQGKIPQYPEVVESSALDDESQSLVDDVYARAMKHATRKLVHDLGRLIGFIHSEASVEIGKDKYTSSKTKKEVDRLYSLVKAIERLGVAASVPSISEFDLAELISATAVSECGEGRVDVQLIGPTPMQVRGDKNLVALVLTSAFCNAVEALTESQNTEPRIIVTWDQSDKDYWVSLLDNGVGPPEGGQQLFEIGTTKKKGHFGLGLAQAKTAALSMRGKVSLDRGTAGGALFEFSWPIKGVSSK